METTTAQENPHKGKKLEELKFDNASIRELPLDKVKENFIRPNVANAFFSRVAPTPVKNPQLIDYSEEALQLLDIDLDEVKRADFAEYFSGNKLLPGSDPAAHCYAGISTQSSTSFQVISLEILPDNWAMVVPYY